MSDQNLSYEQARAELGEVVQQLESGRVPLATAMELWERGEKLATICQQWLDGARAKVAAARESATGEAGSASPGTVASSALRDEDDTAE